MPEWRSHGTGKQALEHSNVSQPGSVIEEGVRIFFPENVEIAANVYIGHDTILKAYFDRKLTVGEGSWIGPQCFIYAAGGITIGKDVGIGPGVKMISSAHVKEPLDQPILKRSVQRAPIVLEDGCDIGAGSVILMGVNIGRNAQIGAGSVVTRNVPPFTTAGGVPAKVIKVK